MINDSSVNIRQDAIEKKLGFKIEESCVSPVGLVVEEELEDIEDLIRLSAFTLFLERRHVNSGMPECCVDGKNIRRLAILLLRNRNVKYLIILQSNRNNPLKHTIENIRNLIEGSITDEKLDYLWTRGRLARYGFKREEFKSAFANVIDLEVEICPIKDLPEVKEKLIKKMEQYIIDMERVVPPPSSLKSLYVLPSSLDDYIMPQAFPARDFVPDRVLHATDVSTLFRLCEQVLFCYGYEVKDYKDVGRWQLGQEVILELSIFEKRGKLEWKKTLEGFLIEIKNFLGEIGIKDSRNAYKTSEYFDRLFKGKKGRKIRHEDFIDRVSDNIMSNILGDSNALIILIGEDDLRSRKRSKIGWSAIRCYMRLQDNNISLSLSHDLRSIDLYDGFPVNFFFCLEYSLKFIRDLMEKLPYEVRTKVRLENLRFIIHYLHAYLDDVPISLIKRV